MNNRMNHWTSEHCQKLSELIKEILTYHQIAQELTRLFGIERTEKSVLHKKTKLNIPTPPKKKNGGAFTRVKILEDGTIQRIERKKKRSYASSYASLTSEQKQKYMNNNRKRLMVEKNFLKAKYDTMANRDKYNKQENGIKNVGIYKCYVTWDQLWNLWEKHKEAHGGEFCAITGKEMTRVGVNPSNAKKYARNWSNVSIDRLDPDRPYTLQNIIFVRWEINKMKNDFPIRHMKKILQIYEDRFIKLKNIL